MNPNMVFMAESRTLTRPTADGTKHAQFRKKAIEKRMIWVRRAGVSPMGWLRHPLVQDRRQGWLTSHETLSSTSQNFHGPPADCEEEAAASVEFPPERKKSSHADRSGKVGGEGGQKAEQTLGRKGDTGLISVWPHGSASPSLAQASS